VKDDEQALYTPAAADFIGRRPNTLYKWRKLTEKTGVQHGPEFAYDRDGVPFYTRGALLDYRRSQAIQTALKARQR